MVLDITTDYKVIFIWKGTDYYTYYKPARIFRNKKEVKNYINENLKKGKAKILRSFSISYKQRNTDFKPKFRWSYTSKWWSFLPDTVFATNKHYTKIFQVEKFGIGTVEGLSPEKLVVVKTNNPNKKLGWG